MNDSTTERDVYPDTSSDVGAIISGMGQTPARDQTRAPLPDSLQPGYRPPMPDQLMGPSQLRQLGIPFQTLPPGASFVPNTQSGQGTDPRNRPPDEYHLGQPIWHPRPGEQGYNPSDIPYQLQPGRPGTYPRIDLAPQQPGPQLAGVDPHLVVPLQQHQQQQASDAQQRFIQTYGPLAAQAGQQLGVDPRLILGQWALESGWGVGGGAATGGNMAGLKNPNGQYETYRTPQEFADAYVRFLQNPRYRGAIGAGQNGDQFFDALKRGGYFGADLNAYKQGVFQRIGLFGTQVQPLQQPVPAEPRGYQDWGKDPELTPASPRDFGPGPSGQQGPFGEAANMQPGESGFTRVLNGIGPLLLGIASIALRLPLSTAITAYGAMARAQDNGQREAYERNRTRFQDQMKEATAQQTLESRDASDAFSEYGNNNPQGLQQRLAQIALQYNDPTMFRMAERGDLNGIHQLQQKRDLYNQDLLKLNKATQDQQDRQAQDAAVTAMDHQWHDKFVQDNGREPTADEAAIAHNEHIGEAGRAGTKDPKSAGTGEEAKVYNVVDKDTGKPTGKQVRVGKNGGTFDLNGQPTTLAPNEKLGDEAGVKSTQDKPEQEGEVRNVLGPDGKPTGQQVREGKTGGYFDPDSGERVHLKPGETIQQPGRGAADTLEATKPYDVLKDGKVVRTVLARERKDRPGFIDAQSGDEIKLGEGEALQPHQKPANDSLEVSKPYDIVDDKGHIVKPNVMLRERKDQAGYVHSETGDPLVLEKGQTVKQITPTTSGGGRAGAQVLRQLVGGREVLSDLENAVRLPVGTTIGPLGTVHPGPSIRDALAGDMVRKLTDQDSQLMQASMASMERELSVLMSPVYGGNWAAQQISPLIPKSGDTIQTVIFKLARLAQSADNALEAASKSPILSNEEQQYANDLRSKIKEAIPWSSSDAMDFVYRGRPKESFGAYVRRQGIGQDQGGQPKSSLPPGVTVEVK